jgi:beta-1,2-mannobiose phosphorylase / 1,2-beta-oligomannan phosphorylase
MKRIFCLGVTMIIALASCGIPAETADPGTWQKSAANPVLRHDLALSANYDHFTISDPCVLQDEGLYKMWYTAGGYTPPDPENHCSIAYATSTDGIHWGKSNLSPVLNNDQSSWDAYAVETVSVLADSEADAAERYKMWYAGRTKPYEDGGPAYDIGYAVSPDGIRWNKVGGAPVLSRGGSNEWDNSFLEGPTVIKDGSVYKMWYAGFDAVADGQSTDGKVSIGYATSVDGIVWTKYERNPVLSVGPRSAWDGKTVQDPCVIKTEGVYRMWYGGASYDFQKFGQQTGYAESSDGISWIKSGDNPVLKRGNPGSWDANTASFPSVLIEGELIKMWYTGRDKDDPRSAPYYWDLGYAEKRLIP